jgi:hypothetical protein
MSFGIPIRNGVGVGLAASTSLRTRSSAGGGVPVPFASVNTLGWNVDYAATPPSLNPLTTFSVSRAGFDDSGNATTISETLTVTQRTRQVFPNEASLTALTVALSDYILSTDTVSGATNNSTETMPKPICNWAMLDRQLIGNSLTLEVTGNHWSARSGRPFRCVVFTATDGTNTVTATATTMTVSGHTGDKNAVLVYQATLDTTTLATGLITCNAKVYPWIGTLATGSVADSSSSSVAREFSPRYFYKDTTRFATPSLAYVASTGLDATGVVSTNAVVAKAAPFLTVQGAINGLVTAVTNVDGCRIRIVDGVNLGANASTARNQLCAAVIVERDPLVSKAAAILTQAATWRARLGVGTLIGGLTEGAVLFRDLTFVRGGAFTLQGEAATQLRVMIADDVDFDNNSQTVTMLSNSHLLFDGCTMTNATAAGVLSAATNEIRIVRGLSVSRSGASTEGWLVLGSTITAPGVLNYGTRSESGSIVQFNRFPSYASTTQAVWAFGNSTTVSTPVSQGSFSQNLIEAIHTTTSNPGIRASPDSGLQNLTHVLIDNNTIAAGHFQVGRMNLFYDETALTNRTHKFCRLKNTVAGGFYIKEDVFLGVNGNGTPNPVDAPNHIGNWHALYGVGAKNLVTLLVNTGANIVGANEGPEYPGLGSTIATSQTVQVPATAAWTNWQATTTSGASAVAGAGGGTYTLPGGSPLLNRVAAADEVFPFDLDGTARTRGSVGAYA